MNAGWFQMHDDYSGEASWPAAYHSEALSGTAQI